MKWTVGAKIATGFSVTLLFLVAIGVVSYRGTNRLTETAHWVTHTHEVLGNLDVVVKALIDTETGQRGYIITGQDQFLEPYHAGIKAYQQSFAALRQLTSDNPAQQRRLDALEPMVEDRLARLAQGIETRRTAGFEAAQQHVSSGQGKEQMDSIRATALEFRDEENRLLKQREDAATASTTQTRTTIVVGTVVAFVAVCLAAYLITRSIASPLRKVTDAARRIAERDLTGSDLSTRSRDEVADLIAAFNTMRTNLREMASQIRQATENVNATAAEVLASTQQQAAAAKEQAATIQEITSTLEEINQAGGQIGDRAKQVSVSVETTADSTQRGMQATQQTSLNMEAIRDQVEEVAENIVALSERTQTIGEIITTVSEISEQSNLLALNASIEAVSAGDQGGRFSVVAHEMKDLADRAKDCTLQVRTILGEIQKGINTSVMLTEEAVKRADTGRQQAHATESTIREVTESNEQSVQAFQQIAAGANQQQIGVNQVTQGMQDIRQAIKQTAASTQQMEKAAASMNALSQQLRLVVDHYRV